MISGSQTRFVLPYIEHHPAQQGGTVAPAHLTVGPRQPDRAEFWEDLDTAYGAWTHCCRAQIWFLDRTEFHGDRILVEEVSGYGAYLGSLQLLPSEVM